jgi:hypothetical protein
VGFYQWFDGVVNLKRAIAMADTIAGLRQTHSFVLSETLEWGMSGS